MTQELKIISRKEALARGLGKYFTGVLCKHGHLCARYIGGCCVRCANENSRRYDSVHSEEKRERLKIYRKRNPEKVRALIERWRLANPEKVRNMRWRAAQRRIFASCLARELVCHNEELRKVMGELDDTVK